MTESEESEFARAAQDATQKQMDESGLGDGRKLRIAVVGRVSSGKSSFINALFMCPRTKPVAPVGAESGITPEPIQFDLPPDTIVIDTPGLEDNVVANSKLTEVMIRSGIDAAIFVVHGACDSGQREQFERVKSHAPDVLVVLNKSDQWDDNSAASRERVQQQWREHLGVEKIYPTVCKGYDPHYSAEKPVDIRGVDEVRNAIVEILKRKKKVWAFQASLKDKRRVAIGVIAAAVAAATGASLVPGGAIVITAIQATTVAGLYYIYTGNHLSATSALSFVVGAMGRAIGMNLFLWTKQFLPPTGIVEVAAAAVAASVTFALLIATAALLESGVAVLTKQGVGDESSRIREAILERVMKADITRLRSPEFWVELAQELLSKPSTMQASANGSRP